MEAITTTDDKQTDTVVSVQKAADEEDLLSVFDQCSDLLSSNLDWLSKDISVVINEASSEGISVENSITFQQCITTALFVTGANMSVMSHKFFNSLPQKPKLIKSNACTVTSVRGTDLGPLGQCYLIFRLGNEYFTDKFIILWDMCRDLILELKLAIQLQNWL